MFLYSTVSTLKPELIRVSSGAITTARRKESGTMGSSRVRTNSGNSRDDLTKLELVENGGFTGGIETDHQDTHLLLPPQLIEDLGKGETHGCGVVWLTASDVNTGKGGN